MRTIESMIKTNNDWYKSCNELDRVYPAFEEMSAIQLVTFCQQNVCKHCDDFNPNLRCRECDEYVHTKCRIRLHGKKGINKGDSSYLCNNCID